MYALILTIALGQLPTLPSLEPVDLPTLETMAGPGGVSGRNGVGVAQPSSAMREGGSIPQHSPRPLSAELERVNHRYPNSVQHTDASGVVWRKQGGRWSHVPGRQGELKPAPVVPSGRPGLYSAAGRSVLDRPFPRRHARNQWYYRGGNFGAPLRYHLRYVHGVRADLSYLSDPQLRIIHSNVEEGFSAF